MMFTTKDQDNDRASPGNCATTYTGAWWHNSCHMSNLNGQYLGGTSIFGKGINWYTWKGYYYSLKRTEMKVKPNSL